MIRRLLHPSSWFVILFRLEKWQRYRRWYGSHWELWFVDTVNAQIWHSMALCSQRPQTPLRDEWWKDLPLEEAVKITFRDRPTPLCRGTPTCEDYPK